MANSKEEKIFEDYMQSKNLRHSDQRMKILEVFLKTEKHLTADELYRFVQKKYPTIGYATIYRTLKLLCGCGICSELMLDDGTVRYEHRYGHEHHDHLICTKCGKFTEVVNSEIERLQEDLAKKKGFVLKKHRLQLYGICRECRSK